MNIDNQGLSFRTCSGKPGTYFFQKIEFLVKFLEFFYSCYIPEPKIFQNILQNVLD